MTSPLEVEPGFGDTIAEALRAATLLRVPDRARPKLDALVARRCGELGVGEAEYLALVREGAPDSGELELLTRELTIGETYFFRGSGFGALRSRVLPDIVSRRRSSGRTDIRVVSAGCATGEEAYSLAILLRGELPGPDAWRPRVIGLDINTGFLERAREASFDRWSLRDLSEEAVARHFTHDPDTNRWRIAEDERRLVRFQYANLATDPLPAPALGVVGVDLIVCQNVLYYFQHRARAAVIEKLVGCLADGGWLLLGPTDYLEHEVPRCRAHTVDDVVIHQRSDARSIVPSQRVSSIFALRVADPDPDRDGRTPMPPAPRVPVEAAEVADASTPRLEDVTDADVELAVRDAVELANAGAFRRAIETFDAVLARVPDHARVQMLRGLLLVEVGAFELARDGLRRAIYLEPDLVLAHVGMVIAGRMLGDRELIRRHTARIAALAGNRTADAPVDGWDGMTAGRLMRLFVTASAGGPA